MKTPLIILLTFCSASLFAQTTVSWIGGTPGQETNWNEAKNWSSNRVPDEFSNVIIKLTNSGHQAQPVIRKQVEVLSVELHGGASLTIEQNGSLAMDGTFAYTQGILLYGGNLVNHGRIILDNLDNYSADDLLRQCSGKGLIVIDEMTFGDGQLVSKH